ncbi:MAG: hypothetical protein KDK53_04835 [Maritimibacter sp.]|nr:hypothetical protein [Maritimibacter sp.]
MSATVIAFARRAANRNTAPLRAKAILEAVERADNIVSLASWRGRAHPRRTASGVFFCTDVLMTTGCTA